MATSKSSDVVKSDKWMHQQLHDQTVTLQHQSGVVLPGRLTAVPHRNGMRVLVSYAVSGREAAIRPVKQQEIDKIELYSDGSTKFRMF